MNDFQKPIHGKDPTSYEPIQANRIEKDKKGKESFTEIPTSSKPIQVVAALVFVFKKFFSFFSDKGKNFDPSQIQDSAAAFKNLLQILADNDQSHDPAFTRQLSESWHHLLNASDGLRESDELKILIREVQHFPPNEDHSLGYYLTEYAGKEWIPFPFMELLEHLHTEPQQVTLRRWIAALALVCQK